LTHPPALSHQNESSNPCVGETPPRPSHDDDDDDDDDVILDDDDDSVS